MAGVLTNSTHGDLFSAQEKEVIALLHTSNEPTSTKVLLDRLAQAIIVCLG